MTELVDQRWLDTIEFAQEKRGELGCRYWGFRGKVVRDLPEASETIFVGISNEYYCCERWFVAVAFEDGQVEEFLEDEEQTDKFQTVIAPYCGKQHPIAEIRVPAVPYGKPQYSEENVAALRITLKDGRSFDLQCRNIHNGYYGHDVIAKLGDQVLFDDCI